MARNYARPTHTLSLFNAIDWEWMLHETLSMCEQKKKKKNYNYFRQDCSHHHVIHIILCTVTASGSTQASLTAAVLR